MEASDGGEVYSPGVRREVFFEKRVLWPWQAVAVDGLRRWRSVLAERRRKAFFKISSLALASRRRIILRREEVFFSAASRKEPKESPQRGLTYGSPPLDSPTPVMRGGYVPTLAEVCIRRKDAFWEAHCVRVHTRRAVYCNSLSGRLTIDAPPRRPYVRPGGSVCGTNGSRDEVFGERFTAGMKFSESASPFE